ncbi:MAG TPA: exosortase O [Myxococcales bacterium]|nr:exosortase O [Myxococcales bacterium]
MAAGLEATAQLTVGARRRERGLRGLLAAAVPAAWLWFQAPVLAWFWTGLPKAEYASSLVLLLAAGGFLAARALRAWRDGRPGVSAWPSARPGPLALAVGAAAGTVALRTFSDANIPAAALFGLGAYGLCGLYVSPASWRRALPGALLLVAALPFGPYLNAYFGFSARLATAELVHALFSTAGLSSINVQTVLLLENGAMNVDLPCSGIRSAWTGLVFFLGATCLERPRLGWRWAAAGAGYLGLLFGANAMRVAVIALVSGAAGQAAAARVIHEPLGVAGFALASLAAYALLRRLRVGDGAPAAAAVEAVEAPAPTPRWLPAALAGAFVLLGLTQRSFALEAAPPVRPLALPPSLAAVAEPFSEAEAGLYGRFGETAGKWRLDWEGHEISLLVSQATSWRAHHPPEQCLRGKGLAIDADVPLQLQPGFPVRWLSVDGGRAAAVYWYQSPSRQVNDLTARIAADLRGGERRWALVTVMVDRPPQDPAQLLPLLTDLRAAVAASFPRDPLP